VAVTDRQADGLSAIYTFFEPELPERSLGVWSVLQQIFMAQRLHLPHLYLGYWIRDSDKMRYKVDYRPVELYLNGRWVQVG
jgi:arginine-tRNA-protein transferase